MTPRLKEQYDKKIVIDLQKKLSMKNKLMVPRIFKVVLNMGLGISAGDKKIVQNCIEDMSLISGQKPVVTKFKKSISNFKTRKGSVAGVKVTLRSNKMYEFIDRLINIALPRIKDFQGLSLDGFDNFGNYSFGIKEHIIFPEINFDKVNRIRGMDITIVTTGKDKKATYALLEALNFPFIKNEKKQKNWGIMAKTSAIQRNLKRIKLSKKFLKKRENLKKIIKNKKLPLEERFAAQLKLAKLPRNSARVRIRNRCEITGRPHGVYRKLRISRIALRDLAAHGKIPGMTKSSW